MLERDQWARTKYVIFNLTHRNRNFLLRLFFFNFDFQKYPALTLEVAGDLRRAPVTFENPVYLVYLWGRPLFFRKRGDENFSKTNNFFSLSLSVKTFFPVSSSCRQLFSCLQKIKLGFFCFCEQIFHDSSPPPLNLYDLPMVYNALIF